MLPHVFEHTTAQNCAILINQNKDPLVNTGENHSNVCFLLCKFREVVSGCCNQKLSACKAAECFFEF